MAVLGNIDLMTYSTGNSFSGTSDGTEREAPIWRILAPIRERF